MLYIQRNFFKAKQIKRESLMNQNGNTPTTLARA